MGADFPAGEPGANAPEVDPLQDFLAEPERPALHPTESKQDGPPAAAARPAPEHADLAERVAKTERLLEKSQLEIAALKSDLATLVTAFDDIKKRQSRKLAAPPVPVVRAPGRMPRVAAAAVGVMLAFAALAAWGALSVASEDEPAPPPIESGATESAETPAPIAMSAPAPVEIQKAAVVTAVLPARDVPAREVPARAAPARAEPRAGYVGTLTVDASPAGEVFLNRKNVGRTPVRLEKLRAGSHLVWIERDGYRRWTRVVPVAADRVSRVTADLDPIPR